MIMEKQSFIGRLCAALKTLIACGRLLVAEDFPEKGPDTVAIDHEAAEVL